MENAIGGAYRSIVIKTTKKLSEWAFAFDRHVMDRIVNGVATMNNYGANSSAWIEKYVVYAGLKGRLIKLKAPLILKEPVICMHSGFKYTVPAQRLFNS